MRYHASGVLDAEVAENALNECKKIKSVVRTVPKVRLICSTEKRHLIGYCSSTFRPEGQSAIKLTTRSWS